MNNEIYPLPICTYVLLSEFVMLLLSPTIAMSTYHLDACQYNANTRTLHCPLRHWAGLGCSLERYLLLQVGSTQDW